MSVATKPQDDRANSGPVDGGDIKRVPSRVPKWQLNEGSFVHLLVIY